MLEKSKGMQNPYLNPDDPLFYGRGHFFAWITQRLVRPAIPKLPIVLYGPPQIGKSALIREIKRGRLGRNVLPILIDWAEDRWQSGLENEEQIWSAVALEIKRQLSNQGILTTSTGDLTKTITAASYAYAGFRDQVLPEYLQQIDQQSVFILFDNVDEVVTRPEFHTFLTHCRTLIEQHQSLFLMVSLTDHPDRYGKGGIVGESYSLGEMEREAATKMLREPVPYYLSEEMIDFALQATHHQPLALQQLAFHLFERWQRGQIGQPLMADLVKVVRGIQEFQANGRSPHVKIPLKPSGSALRSRRGITVGAVIALLIIVGLVGVFWQNRWFSFGQDQANAIENSVVDQAAAPDKIAAAPPSLTPSPTPTTLPTTTPLPEPTSINTPPPNPTAVVIVTTPQPTPTPENTVRAADGMPMMFIPAGQYLRGSAEDDPFSESDERPQREVLIAPFFLDQFEVSMIQYASFLNEKGDHLSGCSEVECVRVAPEVQGTYLLVTSSEEEPYTVIEGFENVPVNHVSWFGAREYCEWVGGRLPTEAEWEYAARGTDGRFYPWGIGEPDRTRAIFGTEYSRLLAVDSLPAGVSPFNVFGMAGSVWEWVNDWYDPEYYEWGTVDNPQGPSAGVERVTRGGSWAQNNDESRIRSNNRNFYPPAAIRADIGFRCAFDVAQVIDKAE